MFDVAFTLKVYNVLKDIVNKAYIIRFRWDNVNFVHNIFQRVINLQSKCAVRQVYCCYSSGCQ
jgi:hypothetical protein